MYIFKKVILGYFKIVKGWKKYGVINFLYSILINVILLLIVCIYLNIKWNEMKVLMF